MLWHLAAATRVLTRRRGRHSDVLVVRITPPHARPNRSREIALLELDPNSATKLRDRVESLIWPGIRRARTRPPRRRVRVEQARNDRLNATNVERVVRAMHETAELAVVTVVERLD